MDNFGKKYNYFSEGIYIAKNKSGNYTKSHLKKKNLSVLSINYHAKFSG